MLNRLQFHGLGVVVTGAAAGLGRASAEAFASLGAHVFAIDIDAAGLDSLRAASAAQGQPLTAMAADITQEDGVRRVAEQIAASGVVLKSLVNNVGANFRKPTHELALDDWNKYLTLNLTSAFLMTRALLPALLAAPRGGSISAPTSTAGPRPSSSRRRRTRASSPGTRTARTRARPRARATSSRPGSR